MSRTLLFTTFVSVSAYHCSNDLPIEAPSREKAAAWATYASSRVQTTHAHENGDSHVAPAKSFASAPGYSRAESRISSGLRDIPRWEPPELAATPLSLDSVTLLPGSRAWASQNMSIAWMTSFDPDRLLYSFRVTANLSTNGAMPYGGWEDPTCLLRGHIAGGHWLSAAALLINGTGDPTLASRATFLVAELAKCQAANTAMGMEGYLSAFPPDHFDRLESNTQPIWAPYYTIHKILRGLYDMRVLAGDNIAQSVALEMISYFANRIRNLVMQQTIAKWYAVMNVEHGGMNEVAWLWFSVSGNADAAYLARMFDTPCWLGPLSLQADILTDEHANTHIPVVLGSATQYEATGDIRLGLAATGFYDAVKSAHTFSTGGSSSGEWWGAPMRLGDQLDINGVESCSTYNILKLSRQLFGWGGDASYFDDFERALYSGMFGTAHPSRVGAIIYLLPLRGPNGLAGGSKAHTYWGWSSPTDSMWCCVGSALESHSKHGDTLFFQSLGPTPTLIAATYENSHLKWGAQPVAVTTLTSWTVSALIVDVNLTTSDVTAFTFSMRIPGWATEPSASVDGAPTANTGRPWFNLTRSWAAGDHATIRLTLPFVPLLEPLADDREAFSDFFSVTVGPFALGAITRVDNVIVGSSATGVAVPWVRPLSDAERAASVTFSIDAARLRHDNETGVWASTAASGPPNHPENDEADADAVWITEPAPGAGASQGLVALRSLNRPGERLVCATGGACVIAHGHDAAFNLSASWTRHSPGLAGGNTTSFESAATPGQWLSIYDSQSNSTWGSAVSLRAFAAGASFASASSFVESTGAWIPPTLSFVAQTGDDSVQGSRDLLLIPIADIADDWYGVYLRVQKS